jgi:heat shock protein HspQ
MSETSKKGAGHEAADPQSLKQIEEIINSLCLQMQVPPKSKSNYHLMVEEWENRSWLTYGFEQHVSELSVDQKGRQPE